MTGRGRIILKKGKAKPFWYQHPWLFEGAIKKTQGKPENGDVVDIADDMNRFVGKGFINFNSKLRVRILSWDQHEKINQSFFEKRIQAAVNLREKILNLPATTNAYRIVHSEADRLPGLTIDRYGNVLVAQFLSLGMDQRKDMIIEALRKVTGCSAVVERYATRYRQLEGLPAIDYQVHGDLADSEIIIEENGLKFHVSLEKGQKTGYYLDQRANREELVPYASGKKVLDAFCYSGGFGIYAGAKGNAKSVTFMDSSRYALGMVEKNLALNKVSSKVHLQKADLFKELPKLADQGEKYDMIYLDPPKVAPDKSSLTSGLHSLKSINAVAMRMLNPGGLLATFDCSGLISSQDFSRVLNQASQEISRPVQIVSHREASPDHPLIPSCPENSYLKMYVAVVS